MKLKPMMCIKTCGMIKINLTTVIIQKIVHSMIIKNNKKVIGKFKDECAFIPITEFIGLSSKMYSYQKDNNENKKTAKGIKKIVIKKNIKHEDYKQTLVNNRQMYHTDKCTIHENHQKQKSSTRKLGVKQTVVVMLR